MSVCEAARSFDTILSSNELVNGVKHIAYIMEMYTQDMRLSNNNMASLKSKNGIVVL